MRGGKFEWGGSQREQDGFFFFWCDRKSYGAAMPHRRLHGETCARQLYPNHFGGKRISVRYTTQEKLEWRQWQCGWGVARCREEGRHTSSFLIDIDTPSSPVGTEDPVSTVSPPESTLTPTTSRGAWPTVLRGMKTSTVLRGLLPSTLGSTHPLGGRGGSRLGTCVIPEQAKIQKLLARVHREKSACLEKTGSIMGSSIGLRTSLRAV